MKMTDLPKLIILDVAHGNCAILQDTGGTVIIDCAHGDTLIETLRHLNISYVDRIIISHADEDHIKGFIDLLSDESIKIGHIYINPDGSKKTRTWMNLRRLISEAISKYDTTRHFIHVGMTDCLDIGQVKIEVLAPPMDLVGQVGGLDLEEKSLKSNSVSAVIRLLYKDRGVALLAGDVDRIGLRNLLRNSSEIEADILIFPHHGGNVGGGREQDNKDFATSLCQQVNPKLVIFSTGRDKHNNPRKEIVKAVLDAVPNVHIMCTQLAKSCAPEILIISPIHLNTLSSKGKENNHCCGGTIVVHFSEPEITYFPSSFHRKFVKDHIPSALCLDASVSGKD
jgi:beta-lactamase superfamily II metal-dependent hydrolase